MKKKSAANAKACAGLEERKKKKHLRTQKVNIKTTADRDGTDYRHLSKTQRPARKKDESVTSLGTNHLYRYFVL